MSRKKITSILILILLSVPAIFSREKNCLWELKVNHQTLYLLGSVHVLNQACYPLPETIENAFQQSEVIVFEANMDSLESPGIQNYLLEKGMYPVGKSLKTELSDSTYQLLMNRAASLGMCPNMIEILRPWLACLTLTTHQLFANGFTPSFGVDYHYHNKAKEASKEIQYFESPKEQIDMLAMLSDEDQEQQVWQTISELDSVKVYVSALIESWQKGDVETLEEIFLGSFEDYEHLYDQLICKRNLKWLQTIAKQLKQDKEQTCFIVVGTAHLIGENGLIQQFQRMGYHPKQL